MCSVLNRIFLVFGVALAVLMQGPTPKTAMAQETKQPSKLAGSLQEMMYNCYEAVAFGPTDLSELSNDLIHVAPSGSIEVLFHSKIPTGEAEAQDLQYLGATIVGGLKMPAGLDLDLPEIGLILAWVPYDALEDAAALDWVAAVTPPNYGEVDPHPTNPIDSEGVQIHNADLLQNQAVNGAGVTVGAISDGVSNLAAAQLANELPAVNVLAAGAGDEGTAMLEIIHDMAPGANLAFSSTGGGVMNHVNAMLNLAAAGANVIAEDIAFDAEPAFQQGLTTFTAEALAAGGVSIHSSAGNRGQNHAARAPATGTGGGPDGSAGPFAGCSFFGSPNVVAIAPGGDTTFDVVLGNSTRFTLQWSEPRSIFPTVGAGGFTDLDLFVLDAGLTQCLGQSVAAQGSGSGDTIEQVTIAGMAGTPVKVVVNVFGTFDTVLTPIIDLRWRGTAAQTDAPTRAGSLNPDSNYTGLATSAAALNATSMLIEGFSSGGPVQLGLTTTCPGAFPCAGAAIAGPGIISTPGPTWTAADGVSVSGAGGFGSGTCPTAVQGQCRFFGTSASAPGAAGCDALIRNAIGAPASPVAPITTRLVNGATAIGTSPDNVAGAGVLDCAGSVIPTAICMDITVPTDPDLCTTVVNPMQVDNGSFDPDFGALTKMLTPPGPFDLGATLVELKVTDPDGLMDSCNATISVFDNQAPALPDCNDVATIVPPDAPISFTATGTTDNCGVETVEITGFDCFKFTNKGKRVDKTGSCVIAINGDTITINDGGGVGTKITWEAVAIDDAGNTSAPAMCMTTVVNPNA